MEDVDLVVRDIGENLNIIRELKVPRTMNYIKFVST